MKLKQATIAFFTIGTAGVLMHFLYEWSGKNPLVGLFAPVNESIWEHLKLIFFPAAVWSAMAYFFSKKHYPNDIAATLIGIFGAMFTIVSAHYTYKGIIGRHIPAIDITLYFLSVIIFLALRGIVRANGFFSSKSAHFLSLIILIITAILFIVFSFYPPDIALFKPPQ